MKKLRRSLSRHMALTRMENLIEKIMLSAMSLRLARRRRQRSVWPSENAIINGLPLPALIASFAILNSDRQDILDILEGRPPPESTD